MSNKLIGVIVGVTLVILFLVIGFSKYDHAVFLEESISNTHSDIQVQEQRRFDLITKLVDVVEANSEYESSTMQKIIEMRKALDVGNIDQVQTLLNAVAEQYPQLKATEGYTQLMTELSITENLISEHRKTFNKSVKSYREFVRQPISRLFLNVFGYNILYFEYLEFNDNTLPENLFGE